MAVGDWVLLGYKVPREPSTPRIALWRALRRLGAVQVLDGLVALPADSRTREQLEWLADEVVEAGGEASVWLARPGSAAQERALATRMRDAVTVEYQAVVNDDLAVLALLCALGLLASFYLMTHFPLSVEDAAFLTSWV